MDDTAELDLPALQPDLATYYRSRVFNAKTGINTLVSHAQPLLALVAELRQASHVTDLATVQDNLAHELKTFESRAITAQHDNELIVIARYILTTHINRLLPSNTSQTFDLSRGWQSHSPLARIYQRITQDPTRFLEVIELAYVCEILSGTDASTIESLYHIIRSHRGDEEYALMLTPKTPAIAERHFISKRFIIGCSGCLILFCYVAYSFLLQLNGSIKLDTTLTPSNVQTTLVKNTHENNNL